MSKQQNDLLTAMDQMKDYIALLTGSKQQLIEQGWSEESAEKIIIHSLTNR